MYLAHARLAQGACYVDSFVYRCLRISGRCVTLTLNNHHGPSMSYNRRTNCNLFTTLMEHGRGLAMRMLSGSLSVIRVICDKTKESCAHILIPHERSFTLVL